jgi:GT2 family glycosyltransferase
LPDPLVTVAIPTLSAGPKLAECLAALERQTLSDFEVFVIDNSGQGLARETALRWRGVSLIENTENLGFGAAVNSAFRRSAARYAATLNDDAVADPGWLCALVRALESRPDAGMCASQVRLTGGAQLDSAGMLLSSDGSSKQRGHLEPPSGYAQPDDVLFPSGSAALYRRKMLDEIGLFDEKFFLYCEDTDLGLRARWAGWTCVYAPDAVVEHHYSQTAGAASPLKAYYVERNRIFVLLKNFPATLLLRAPAATVARYFWHLAWAFRGRGAAARYGDGKSSVVEMAYIAFRAHAVLIKHAARLLRQRRRIRSKAKLTPREFKKLVAQHFIGPREVASL